MTEYIKVEEHPKLVRDTYSRAIINTDVYAYEAAITRSRNAKQQKDDMRDAVRDIKASYLSGGQKKRLVIALSLLGNPKILLLDEPFAALDIMTIKTLQKIIVNLQSENNITIILCDHQARDLLSCVDIAIVLSNCKVVASGTPSELINNNEAKNAYFGDSFKIN